MSNSAVARIGNAQITDVGIKNLDNVSEGQFFECGRQLASIERGLQWAIGDWYNNIPWGDKEAACKEADLSFATAHTYGWVAEQYKIATRVAELSFKHHRVVLHENLSALDRKRLLKKAAKGEPLIKSGEVVGYKPWSSARLLLERNIILGIAPPAVTGGFDNGVSALEKSVVASLPEGTGKKTINAVVRGLRKEADKLKHEFTKAVDKEAEAKAKVMRDNMREAQKRADEQYEKAVKMSAGVKAFLSRSEFQLIRSCLHPDKNPHKNAGKAFDIFNRLADVKDW